MPRRVTAVFFTVFLVFSASPLRAARAQEPSGGSSAGRHQALVSQYCVTCHNERNKLNAGALVLDGLDASKPADHPDTWEKVIRKLRAGQMPPAGARRPDSAAVERLVTYLEADLDRTAAVRPDPGRTEPLHRLNRTEYRNAIRDLFALDIDVKDLLPSDSAGGGNANFDNIAASLRFSESLLDRYLAVAQKVAGAAVGEAPPLVAAVFKATPGARQGFPLGSQGGIRVEYAFPVDAEYEFRFGMNGGRDNMDFSIDGQPIKVTGEARAPATRGGGGAPIPMVRVPVKAGPRVVIATFRKSGPAVLTEADREPSGGGRGSAGALSALTITGPFEPSGPGETPSREKIFVCRPASAADEEPCARRIFTTLARRAYRRPVTPADLAALMSLYTERRALSGFDAGIQAGIKGLLVSPSFLVRVEADPVRSTPGTIYKVSSLELASRLSFFLWSSIPDDELLDLAVAGRLREPAVLEKQVRRMLADPRAEALTTNFAAQWLYLRNLEYVLPSEEGFPSFDESLRQSLFKELTLFVDSVRHEDRTILDLLDADYTFLDERLAAHYRIPGVIGSDFKRVSLPADSPRRGLLGKGSILIVTSLPQRTSPVLRGKWILENVLGTPPPPPPPGVPPLGEQKQNDGRVLPVRELLSRHRANPFCSNCHSVIDPPGFALEGFDAIGRWRSLDENFESIDASGALVDGTKFRDLAEFRAGLLGKPAQFARTFTEKLLTFALGRGLTHADAPAVRQIVRQAAKQNYRFSAIVRGVVTSAPFQMRKTAATAVAATSASR